MENKLEPLQWRYAVKKYDSSKKPTEENVQLLKEAIRLAPSSHGLQPYKILLIEDPEIRAKLREASFGQAQVTDGSHFMVFAIETQVDEDFVDQHFKQICIQRQVPLTGGLLAHRNSVASSINRMSEAESAYWATNQAYLALGGLLYTAAQMKIDANPMEGFSQSKYNEILGLDGLGLNAVVIVSIGYRHGEDHYQHLKKVRKPLSELFITI